MNLLFIIKTNDQKKGGSVFAPLIIRDAITDIYKIKIVTLYFKEKNFLNFLFNFKITEPKFININPNLTSIEINSFVEFLIWLSKNLTKYNLTIFHGVWSHIYIICAFFCIFKNQPFCFQPHGSLDPFDLNKKKKVFKRFLGYSIYKYIFNYASGIIFTSKIESFRSITYGAKVKKYIAKLTSPSKSIYQKLNSDQISKIKTKYKISSNQKILLFLSRIDSKKGLDILLRSFKNLEDQKSKVVLLIAGTGEKNYMNQINNLIKDLKLSDNLRILGHISGTQKNEVMQISDLFVLPTLNENFGIAIVEALQNNLPVLITKDVYIYEDIIKCKAGYLCNRNPANLSKLIRELIHNEYPIKGNNCSNCFNTKYSWKICAEEHFNIYSKMINAK